MPRNRKLLLWPVAAIVIGVLVSVNPFYAPEISFRFGVAALFVAMAVALICWVCPTTARVGVLLTGVSMGNPYFVDAPPLVRGWLMCAMLLPPALASVPVLAPSVTGILGRLALLCSFDHTRELKRSPRYVNWGSLLQSFAATIVFAMALDGVEAVPARASWYFVRWLAGGVMILAFAEMLTAIQKILSAGMGLTAPLLMESPFLSASINEFWAKRWNPGVSVVLHRNCFEPLARRRPVLALFAVFIVSGVMHLLLFYVALLNWKIAMFSALFFFVQPFFILAERKLNVHRWPTAGGRAWTLAALAITSPLFVEPVIQVIQSPGPALLATFIVLKVIIVMASVFLFAAFIACSGVHDCLAPAKARESN